MFHSLVIQYSFSMLLFFHIIICSPPIFIYVTFIDYFNYDNCKYNLFENNIYFLHKIIPFNYYSRISFNSHGTILHSFLVSKW